MWLFLCLLWTPVFVACFLRQLRSWIWQCLQALPTRTLQEVVCRPEESIYLEHGVQQKQAIYEGLVLKTQELGSVFGRLARLTSPALVCPGFSFQPTRALQLDLRLVQALLPKDCLACLKGLDTR